MVRLWILFRTELMTWLRDPISALGGVIPSAVMLVAFGLLFGGRLTFKIAVVNRDTGPYGETLQAAFSQVLSPFDTPYYDVLELEETKAWDEYHAHRIDGVWVIPADFSQRVKSGSDPKVEMHFSNYNDDRAKNHRIYAAEILWRFYTEIGLPDPPLALAEEYPRPDMVAWFPIIAVGVVQMSAILGGMLNIFMLTYKEQTSRITIEFSLAPRSLVWVFLPKVVLALLAGLATSTLFLLILRIWLGVWPGGYLSAVWLLSGLVSLFWIAMALLLGLRASNYMAGTITAILSAITLFFVGGGLSSVRGNEDRVLLIAWLFPNAYVIDPLRDLVLYATLPHDMMTATLKVTGFAVIGLIGATFLAAKTLRRTA